jgi:hypothetical protein
VVAIGAVVGIGLALSMVYQLPSFTPRDAPVWTATSRLLVTSSEGQYVRVSVPRLVEPGASSESTTPSQGGQGGGGGPLVVNEVPNVQPLLTAANLYPLLIESDDVAKLREEKFGPLPGVVTSRTFTAVSTPSRFSPAQLPVVDIFATSPTPRQAIALADATADAFKRYIRAQQTRAGVAAEERILIQDLQAPGNTYSTGGPSYGIPILVALALIAAFGMLAVLLDQLYPRGSTAPQPQSETT